MDHDLRVPYIVSEESIDLIRKMLDRDVAARITVEGVISHSWLKPGIIEDEDEDEHFGDKKLG